MHTPDHPILTEQQRQVPQLRWVDSFSRVLDTKFRIPGTDLRFGLDFILGLVPGAGDIISLGMSGTLVATMARHGASPMLVARMLVNVVLDAFVGAIPILGNLFDLVYKANYRNAQLMKEYYEEGKHRGSVWPVVLAVIAAIVVLMIVLVWVTVKIFELILGLF
ncbi:DUF4112 domain-containing protein [Lewinella sp. JB7]|uniref:DUF4112 domain-containing protein n=1 Tax=Lewinella sp. JB7 TaxID=2962887 RepID=UPI0020CA02F9|nr:DUF4112 domain-containing protein [Lewinella sp. JB7]MCP9235875.1 DUF4112 domain-containing protein [Lewinella sp. JB7]